MPKLFCAEIAITCINASKKNICGADEKNRKMKIVWEDGLKQTIDGATVLGVDALKIRKVYAQKIDAFLSPFLWSVKRGT
jgi:hypothetical protein